MRAFFAAASAALIIAVGATLILEQVPQRADQNSVPERERGFQITVTPTILSEKAGGPHGIINGKPTLG